MKKKKSKRSKSEPRRSSLKESSLRGRRKSQKKPSRHLEDSSLPEISKTEYKEIISKHGESAYEHYYAGDDTKFAIGDDARAARKELLGTGKRVPNDTYVARSISAFLRGRGIRDVSPSTVYDWSRAAETREALGGKEKAPKQSISFYVKVSRNAIPIERRRELLIESIHNNLSTGELEARVLGTFKNTAGPATGNTEVITDPGGLERALNQARSILTNTFVAYDCSKHDESARWTIGSLENLAVYIWQFRDDLESGAAGGKQ